MSNILKNNIKSFNNRNFKIYLRGERKLPYKTMIQDQYKDISNLTSILSTMVNSYRLLIGSANDLSNLPEAKDSKIKDAVNRANTLGKIIDEVISAIDECSYSYIKYCKIKKDIVEEKTNKGIILNEINDELNFKQ